MAPLESSVLSEEIYSRSKDAPELLKHLWAIWVEDLFVHTEMRKFLDNTPKDAKKIWDTFMAHRKVPGAPVAGDEFYDFIRMCISKGFPN